MAELYKLQNEIKHYAWGSPDLIPSLLGKANPSGEPCAELWIGTHPGGPSTILVQGKSAPLSELAELPFLFKFLAAGSPLSIQAHPNLAEAREGFLRENKAGIPISAANRNYRDPNHKPEIICALNHFTAMAGFREQEETIRLLSLINGTGTLIAELKKGCRPFLSALFGLNEAERKQINDAVLKAAVLNDASPKEKTTEEKTLALCGELAQSYPNDPGIIAPLYLNVIHLQPFEALFIPAGILHAYINGFAVECMANSDNVLRGGLTPKYIDVQELFSILNFEPFKPELLKPVQTSSAGCYSYVRAGGTQKTLCDEFTLYLIQHPASPLDPALPDGTELEASGMGIAAVFNGTAEISVKGAGQKSIVLNKGESAFISRRERGERLVFSGNFTLFTALVPE